MRNLRILLAAAVWIVASLALMNSCGDSNVETVQKGQHSASPPAPATSKAPASNSAAGTTASAAGVTWTIPEGWDIMGPRPMRAATYMIGQGAMESECGVFFFGDGQGGDVQSNLTRWIGQFQQPDGSDSRGKAKTFLREIDGMRVLTLDLSGTYVSGGMSGQPVVPKPGFRLLGAMIETPQGPLFFKLTGPAAAVEEIKPHFDTLVVGLKKSS